MITLRRRLLPTLAFAAALALPVAARALTCDWTGAVSIDWANPANWSNCGGGIPGAADTAAITNVPNQPWISTATPVGGLSLGSGAVLTIAMGGNLTLDGNAFGAGNITVIGTLTWIAGSMSGAGSTTISPSGTLSLSTMATKVLSRNLVNEGTTMATGGNSSLIVTAGVAFTNEGLYDIQNGSDITGAGEFQNTGTFRVSVSGSTTGITVATWVNSGTVEVLTGTLSFAAGNGTHGGTYNFAGTRLYFPSGTHTVTAILSGSVLEMNTAVAFLDAAIVASSVGTMEIRGPVSFDTGEIIQPTTLILQGAATISGGDNLTALNCIWDAGTLTGTGTFTILATGTLVMNGSGARTLDRDTFNFGAASMDLVAGTLVLPANRTFHNEASGTFTIHNDAVVAGEGVFDNAGLFRRTTSPGLAFVNLYFTNTGNVILESGMTVFHAHLQTAGSTVLDGGDLEIVHEEVFLEGGTLEGDGEIAANVFASQNAGITPGTSPGKITIHGSYAQSAPSRYVVELAGTSPGQFDQVEVDLLATLGGTLNVSLSSFTPSAGDTFPVFLYDEHFGKFSLLDLPAAPAGLTWLPRYGSKAFSLRLQSMLPTVPLRVDERPASGGTSNVNGVFEDGERVVVEPAWINPTAGPIAATGAASNFFGPPQATYTLIDGASDYGTISASNGTANCFDATGNCYELHVQSTMRPGHWDATLDETLSNGDVSTWTLHIGESFSDVPPADPFYRFVETIFHNLITAGCGGGQYCGAAPIQRSQMAVFLLVSRFGAYLPPPETGTVFTDVPAGSFAAAFIEDLAARQITAGCGGGNFCPGDSVTREQMAVFLLRTLEGPIYVPPDCTTPTFADVPCASGFARWIEELHLRGITAGCAPGLYCPANPVTRGQMAVFLTVTFGLRLNGA